MQDGTIAEARYASAPRNSAASTFFSWAQFAVQGHPAETFLDLWRGIAREESARQQARKLEGRAASPQPLQRGYQALLSPTEKSVPEGKLRRQTCSRADASIRSMSSGVLLRHSAGSSNPRSILPASLARRSRSSWNRESATASIAAITSRSVFAAQVGNPVLGHDDIAQMAQNGGVAIVPADVRGGAPACFAAARSMMMERASSSAKLCATKLNWPPTPLTAWPSSSPSDTTAPGKVASIAGLMKRASTRARRLAASSP